MQRLTAMVPWPRFAGSCSVGLAIIAQCSLLTNAVSCEFNDIEKLRKRFEVAASNSYCLQSAPELGSWGQRSICSVKRPPPEKSLRSASEVFESYGLAVAKCDDRRFMLTWLDFAERLGRSCTAFESRNSFGGIAAGGQTVKRLANAGLQCLADAPASRAENRNMLIGYVSTMLNQLSAEDAAWLYRQLLIVINESFSYLGPQESRLRTLSEIAVAIVADENVRADEWPFFLAHLSDRFPGSRASFVLQPVDQIRAVAQLNAARPLLKQ